MHPAALSLAAVLASCSAAGRPIVTEVYYDAPGDDTGREFIELYNLHAATRSLSGLRLEAGDGSGPGRWTLRWTGGPPDSLPAGGRFVIGGALVTPPPDAVISLDLQNGPDAVRLVWPDGSVETVGYGVHEFAEYACGEPAADATSGQSLARIPDASELGSNALDFRAAAPSPGRANRPGRDAAIAIGTLRLEPEQPDPGAPASLHGMAVNRGAEAIAAGDVAVEANAGAFTGVVASAMAPGDSAAFSLVASPLPAGAFWLVVRVRLAGDEAPENDSDSLRVRVGPGPLAITEIQFHPAHGEGEWVEVLNRADAPIDLTSLRLSDRTGSPGTPELGLPLLPRDSLAVLVQDKAALLMRHPRLDPGRVWEVRPWASLNNTDDSDGVADAVVVREADDTPVERLAYSARGVPAGVPLERRDGGLWPSLEAEGTPLSPPSLPVVSAGAFEVRPRRVSSGSKAVRLEWALPWSRSWVLIDAYDLAGRRVAPVLLETQAPARGRHEWNAGAIAPGVYVLVLRARAVGGSETHRSTALLRVGGSDP